MGLGFRLSQFLTEHLDELDEGAADEKGKAKDEARKFTRELVAGLLEPHVQFSLDEAGPRWAELKQMYPQLVERSLDDGYTRSVLALIPDLVRRTMKLSVIIPKSHIPVSVNIFIGEAARSYIFGFWQGSVALSRAAVEEAIRERLERSLGARSTAKLHQLIETATRTRLFDKPHAEMAARAEEAGNRLLHGKPTAEKQAWESLLAARGVVAWLYQAKLE